MTIRILIGDARAALRTLDGESVDCCITSPPYWSLRDYGVEGQLGREDTRDGYVAALVEVFEEVKRVLRPEGLAFLNVGDCYRDKRLQMVPNRVAVALDDAGWLVRSEIVWAKPNPMPESVKSRPSAAHEKIFMLARSGRHFYDDAAGQVPVSDATVQRGISAVKALAEGFENRPHKYGEEDGGQRRVGEKRRDTAAYNEDVAKYAPREWTFGKAGSGRNDEKRQYVPSQDTPQKYTGRVPGRTASFQLGKEAREHQLAAYAPKKAGPNSLARRGREHRDGPGSQDGQHARRKQDEAGNPTYVGFNARWDAQEHVPSRRLRNYEEAPLEVWRFSPAQFKDAHFATFPPTLVERCLAIGCPEGGTVLDPFGGAGTTGLVADQLGYDAILAELNPEYASLAVERIRASAPLTADVRAEPVQEDLL